MRITRFALPVAALTVALPMMAEASEFLTTILGLFNVFVGLLLTASLLAYGAGFVIWITRLGTWPTYRTEGVKITEWAVVMLFVLVIMLAIVQYFQRHPQAAVYTLATIVALIVLWLVIQYVVIGGGDDEKKKH